MSESLSDADLQAAAIDVLKAEIAAIQSAIAQVDGRFADAARRVASCRGRVVVSGMGKSGLVGAKLSATLASTGTPSMFLHPAEAIHGDLGRVVRGDLVVALSNSGETKELTDLLPALKKIPVEIVSITGRPQSTLARHADVALSIGPVAEACPLGLAPSASTTATLALGDALALVASRLRNFSREEYAAFHPGGSLGAKLMLVREVMRTGDANPAVSESALVVELLGAITRARAGAASIVDKDGRLAGIFTDGDLRRHCTRGGQLHARTGEVMTRNPYTVGPDMLAAEALGIMKSHKIDELPVVDAAGRPVGMLDVQDLLEAGI